MEAPATTVLLLASLAGLWARRDRTPFGYGRPYSTGQLETQLRKHQFLPERHLGALYQVPSSKKLWMKSGPALERIGRRMPTFLAGGAFMVEATKLVYPPKGEVQRHRAVKPVGVLNPSAKPV